MSSENAGSTPRDKALDRCNELIDWYDKTKRQQHIAYQSFQVAAIVLSGVTPSLILWNHQSKVWQALPAALAGIAMGLIGIFQWRANYVRFGYVCEALKSEKLKFETRTTADYDTKLDEHEALGNFVTRMEALVMSEVTDWRGQMQKAADDSKPGDPQKSIQPSPGA
jgi:hypothetical protein